MSLALGDEIARTLGTEPSARGFRVPRVANYLGQWIRCTDWWPDWQLRLYDRRAGQWDRVRVHESVRLNGPTGTLHGELLHYPYTGISDHLDTIDRYTTLAAREMHAQGRRSSLAADRHPPAAGVPAQLRRARRLPAGHAGPDRVAAQLLLRAAQVREALGAAAAGPRGRDIVLLRSLSDVFSLHIDTARSWRGGQNQVLRHGARAARAGPSRHAGRASGWRAAAPCRGGPRPDPARAGTRAGPEGGVAAVARDPAPVAGRRARARSARRRDGVDGVVDAHAIARRRRWSRRGASTSA